MLVGREAECTRIDQLLACARGGTGGALLLSGEAGIGKSALCGYAIECAGGMTVLSAHGMESEAELPFAGLLELFRGRLDHLDDLPAPQAAALGGALALSEQTSTDRFAIYAGVLSLLAALAEGGPILVVIDDVQWIDAPSAEAVLFAARRLGAERIGVLIAGRDDVRFDVPPGVPRVLLGGLSAAAGRALLAREPRSVAPAVRDRLLEAMRGNPLALTEITGTLDDDQLTGARPLDDPLSAGPTLERALLRRVAPLPDTTRRALLVAAASDTDSVERALGGLWALGLEASSLAPAERAGAIDIAGRRLRFRHPLLRSAVYHGASTVDRRAAHRALAETSDGERRAWHLAAAAVGPDETVAQALEDAARTAATRGAHAAAARALERSAGVSPDVDQRVRRLTEAARETQVAGRAPDDGRLLERAMALTHDPVRRAEIQLLRGRQIVWHGEPGRAHELLVREAGRVRDLAPGMAAMMLAEAVVRVRHDRRRPEGARDGAGGSSGGGRRRRHPGGDGHGALISERAPVERRAATCAGAAGALPAGPARTPSAAGPGRPGRDNGALLLLAGGIRHRRRPLRPRRGGGTGGKRPGGAALRPGRAIGAGLSYRALAGRHGGRRRGDRARRGARAARRHRLGALVPGDRGGRPRGGDLLP